MKKQFLLFFLFVLISIIFLANNNYASIKTPVNTLPANHATGITSPYDFTWSLEGTGGNPDAYQLEISLNSTFTLIVFNQTGITDLHYIAILSGFDGSTTYYWRVTGSASGQPNTVSAYTDFTTDAGLPVELTSFSASISGENVNLKWNTATEINNYGFEVQRSSKVGNWEALGFVQGHGNSNSPKNYSFTDDKIIASGKYSYRLKQIDNDGSFKFSRTIEVNFAVPTVIDLSQNYPNPFNPSTIISFTLPESGNVLLKIFNPLGEEVAELVNGFIESGVHIYNFNAGNLPSGIYIYQLKANGLSISKKMLLMK